MTVTVTGTWTRWLALGSTVCLWLFGCGSADRGVAFSNIADGGSAGLGNGGHSGDLSSGGGVQGGADAQGGVAIGIGEPGRRGAVVSGGARLASTSYQLIVTIGEPPSGNAVLASPSFTLQTGIVSQ